MPAETVLAIDGVPLPAGSARYVNQSLTLIDEAGNFRRTVNMELRNLAPGAAAEKYRTSITCDDVNAPMWDGLRKGLIVTVDCVSELYHKVGELPSKTVVTGSERTVGSVVYYRPQLSIMITDFGTNDQEIAALRGWFIEGQEP
jgi:hypothetical protein